MSSSSSSKKKKKEPINKEPKTKSGTKEHSVRHTDVFHHVGYGHNKNNNLYMSSLDHLLLEIVEKKEMTIYSIT
jgi:hypothetical protein